MSPTFIDMQLMEPVRPAQLVKQATQHPHPQPVPKMPLVMAKPLGPSRPVVVPMLSSSPAERLLVASASAPLLPVTPQSVKMVPAPASRLQPPASSVQTTVRGEVRQAPSVVISAPVSREVQASVSQSADDARAAYLSQVRGIIDRKKFYPPLAQRSGMEGTVILRFILARNGVIRSTAVIRSSGRPLLDNAGLQTVESITTFPSLPKEIQGDEVTLEVPVTYRLRD